jgi:hypothetical protein
MPKSTLIHVYTLIGSVFNTTTLNVPTSIFCVSIDMTRLQE